MKRRSWDRAHGILEKVNTIGELWISGLDLIPNVVQSREHTVRFRLAEDVDAVIVHEQPEERGIETTDALSAQIPHLRGEN